MMQLKLKNNVKRKSINGLMIIVKAQRHRQMIHLLPLACIKAFEMSSQDLAKRRGRAEARSSAEKLYRSINKMSGTITPAEVNGTTQMGGKRRGVPVKTLKKILKKAGLKTTGKKAALTRRAKQAKLVKKGGVDPAAADEVNEAAKAAEKAAEEAKKLSGTATVGGRKRKSRSRGMRFF